MSGFVPSTDLIERVRAGHLPSVARLISRAEAGNAEVAEALARIYRLAGNAHVIGITGVPGSGKSTLVGKLAERFRSTGRRVGIIAIDPSSPYSGGAILGDRIRMSDLALDPGVFIRSMATRGATGGMARAALDAVDILDVAGFEIVIIETVGVGQDEVEIARATQTTVVVSAPGLGDEIQAIKAGILEIADIHVVSKSDRSDANRTLADLKNLLVLHRPGHSMAEWTTPVIGQSSVTGEGLDALADAIERHRAATFGTDIGRRRLADIAGFRLRKTAENLLLARFDQMIADTAAPFADQLARREDDPYSLAEALIAASFAKRESP